MIRRRRMGACRCARLRLGYQRLKTTCVEGRHGWIRYSLLSASTGVTRVAARAGMVYAAIAMHNATSTAAT